MRGTHGARTISLVADLDGRVPKETVTLPEGIRAEGPRRIDAMEGAE